ncbi:MAG: type II toxin-antitoxin system PemK/MazF family toxin [Xenococcus sp. (in: cyanobacteria)]
MVAYPQRSQVWLVSLEPTIGSEIKKRCDPADFKSAKECAPRETRPCVVVSPDETNRLLRTVIVAPLTSAIKNYPTRIVITFQNRQSSIALDQIRTVDKSRLLKKLGEIAREEYQSVADILVEMFSF